MKRTERQRLEDILRKLENSLHDRKESVQAMYLLHGFYSKSASPLSEKIQSVLEKFDDFYSREFYDQAREHVERVIGLLEGYLMWEDIDKVDELDQTSHPTFTLNSDERKSVLALASEMRACVVSSDFFDHAHKARLIKRISAIEVEVHKPIGMFDVILGGLSDTGEALGKFGNDVKPLVDRMKEIAKITRKKSEEYDSLPAPEETKRLPAPDSSEK